VTRGAIDLKVVRDRLEIVSVCLADLRALPRGSLDEFLGDRRNPAAADSLLRRAIEAIFDTARHILAKGFGVGALEYRDVARRTAEHGVIDDKTLQERFVRIAGFRNRLAHHYDDVTPAELFGILSTDLADLEALADALRRGATRLSAPPEH
jgi:uncharacterized protein YutE (UPF0331/DUF86 family)